MKDWILTIGIEKYYLTEKEKDFYLQSIGKGVEYVVINPQLILGSKFQTLIHKSVQDEVKQLEAGKTKCEFGKWHHGTCHCEYVQEFEKLNPGMKMDQDVWNK